MHTSLHVGQARYTVACVSHTVAHSSTQARLAEAVWGILGGVYLWILMVMMAGSPLETLVQPVHLARVFGPQKMYCWAVDTSATARGVVDWRC